MATENIAVSAYLKNEYMDVSIPGDILYGIPLVRSGRATKTSKADPCP